MNVDDLAVFKLSRGSHEDPQHGVCFMEAVAWMQGESHSDKPECACPILGRYGIGLNDLMNDEFRHLLNPLVLKMAGTRSEQHETKRNEYIIRQTAKRVVPLAFEAVGMTKQAGYLRALADDASLSYINGVCKKAANAAADAAAYAAAAAAAAADADAYAAAYAAAAAAADAYADAYAAAAAYAADVAADNKAVWTEAVSILSEAIELGPHGGDFYPIHDVRLETFKREIIKCE